MKTNKILQGDALEVLKTLPSESINCCVTSPPYWALRDYGVEGQLGLEPNFNDYINKLCNIFDEVKRVLRKDGTLWVNIGDTYYTKSGSAFIDDNLTHNKDLDNQTNLNGSLINNTDKNKGTNTTGINKANEIRGQGLLQDKNLCNIPARFSIEMQNRGWILRNVIIWYKPNCMPSSVKDRFTVDFEYVYFFVKNKKYWFEQQLEPVKEISLNRAKYGWHCDRPSTQSNNGIHTDKMGKRFVSKSGRNKRAVWRVTTKPYKEAHFATYPKELIEPMIKAGCPINGIVLDPFFGSGTTGLVALEQNKKFIGIELNPKYIDIANKRLKPILEQTILYELQNNI